MDRVIPLAESLNVEFKSDRSKLSDGAIIDAVVAFANTDGGDIYLGVENDGTVTGVHKDHRDITRLSAFIANNTIPPVSVRTEIIDDTQPVLMISVPRCRSIVASASGKIQRRRIRADGEPENVPMYPYEINTRLSELALLDFSAQPVPGARADDLDPLERERLRRIILSYNGERTLLELSDDELDKALRLTTDEGGKTVPTYTGLLLTGRTERLRALIPTAESSFQALLGTDVTANETFYLPLLAAIEKMIGYVEARNPEQEIEIDEYRMSIPAFDKRAVREAIVNAYAHRDYTRLGRVLVQMDADGLTVSNPGGFVEGVTYANILSVEPHGRNPLLADALKRLGLAERTGRGVDRIYEGSLRYGRACPDYSGSTSAGVRLFIPRSRLNEQFIVMTAKQQRMTGEPLSLNALLILNALYPDKVISEEELSTRLALPQSKVYTAAERLRETGLLAMKGSGAERAYALNIPASVHNSPKGPEAQQPSQRAAVLQLAKAQDGLSRKDVMNLLGLSGPQAYRLLQKMLKDGDIERSGEGNATRYKAIRR